jgi:hypothetical protein
MRSALTCIFIAVFIALIYGCSIPKRLESVPEKDRTKAVIPGMPGVRYWVDTDIEPMTREAKASVERERSYLARQGKAGSLPPAYFLAISGGGDNGAFTAGLLNGWTAAGDRPQFKGVTGISTGALIAPFAFLGPDYDHVIKKVYTGVSSKDIFDPRSILAVLFDDGMADTRPLWKLLEKYVNEELLQKIAEEYQKGRILLIATVNLDMLRPVIWNMGAIASSKDPKALELFRSVMVASASIPGMFPPVMIEVDVDGKPYQEMHVDGGTAAQVFVYPPGLDVHKVGPVRERKLYIIRNARLDPDWATVERRTVKIGARAVSGLIQSQGVGDLYMIYVITQRDGIDYNLAYIGEEFNVEHKEEFDTNYMRHLYDYGYQLGIKGYPWQKYPPGFTAP